jgi:purine-nucleoside phosphorylase
MAGTDRQSINRAADFLKTKINETPTVGLILGSGLGVLADEIKDPIKIPYEKIPDFPVSTVTGHKGQLVFGKLNGLNVVAMQGRFHYYEGYSMQEVTLPVRVMKAVGIKTLIVTNAAGGINTDFQAGNLMIIQDHINFLHNNPLIGSNDESLGVRFPDMSNAYSERLRGIAKTTAKELNLNIKEGTYLATTGPTYETPAEIRMMRKLGADAAGMSTVPEVIAARHASIEVLGVSCITNLAAGILDQPLSHDEVIDTTKKVQKDFLGFIKTILSKMEEK